MDKDKFYFIPPSCRCYGVIGKLFKDVVIPLVIRIRKSASGHILSEAEAVSLIFQSLCRKHNISEAFAI